jgi:hypothetical protein
VPRAEIQADLGAAVMAFRDRHRQIGLRMDRACSSHFCSIFAEEFLIPCLLASVMYKDIAPLRLRYSHAYSRSPANVGLRIKPYFTRSEVRAFVRGDLNLYSEKPYILFREGTTKDKDKRAVPLRLEIAEELRTIRPPKVDTTAKVFWYAWPTYDSLQSDLKRAGVERKEDVARVISIGEMITTLTSLCFVNHDATYESLRIEMKAPANIMFPISGLLRPHRSYVTPCLNGCPRRDPRQNFANVDALRKESEFEEEFDDRPAAKTPTS